MHPYSNTCTVATPLLKNWEVHSKSFGRGYIPHVHGEGLVQHVILHLSDALPAKALERIRRETERLPEKNRKRELAEKIEAWSDAGYGCCALSQPEHADQVLKTLYHFQNIRYCIYAWVLMPNHVHLLFETKSEWRLDTVVTSWKKFSATEILKKDPTLPRPLWQREYWDRYIRNRRHFSKTLDYIHQNPVKAGLARTAEGWPWSTARRWQEFGG